MAVLTTFEQADQKLHGQLRTQLRRWREARVPASAIARMVAVDTGVSVSSQTVRRWLLELDRNGEAA